MLDASRTMNGTYGQVFQDGVWLTNVTSFTASVEIEKEAIKVAGSRWSKHKVVGLNGTGTLSGFKVTTELMEKIAQVANDKQGAFVTELIGKVADPENGGTLRVRLKSVQFDSIDLINYEVGSLVNEELSFTFEGFEYLNTISE